MARVILSRSKPRSEVWPSLMRRLSDGRVRDAFYCPRGAWVPEAVSDNYSILLAHFTRQSGVDAQEIRKFLDISDDYEDIY